MLFRSDRKSTRLNSSHTIISYAVFCLKKKNTTRRGTQRAPTALPPPPRGAPPRVRRRSQALEGRHAEAREPEDDEGVSFFFLMIRRPPRSPLFPSPTPFR